MSLTHQSLLDAMDGIAMILDRDLRIVQIGEPNWQKFHDENTPQSLAARNDANESVLGRPVTQFFAGETVRNTFAEIFNKVLSGRRPVVRIDYHCDAPTLRRDMRLSATQINSGGAWTTFSISRWFSRFSSVLRFRYSAQPLRNKARTTS